MCLRASNRSLRFELDELVKRSYIFVPVTRDSNGLDCKSRNAGKTVRGCEHRPELQYFKYNLRKTMNAFSVCNYRR